jgi:hypothetical protein
MPTTTNIHVSECDNELYILAAPCKGTDSSEVLHIKSGYNDPVEYDIRPQVCLAPGDYNLIMAGINWGGPDAFTVTLTTDGVDTPYTFQGTGATGVSWSETVQITV